MFKKFIESIKRFWSLLMKERHIVQITYMTVPLSIGLTSFLLFETEAVKAIFLPFIVLVIVPVFFACESVGEEKFNVILFAGLTLEIGMVWFWSLLVGSISILVLISFLAKIIMDIVFLAVLSLRILKNSQKSIAES